MANKIYLSSFFGFRQDSMANWEAANPVPERGEPCIAEDGADGEWLKIGDGESDWRSLPWKRGPKGEKGDKGDTGEKGDDYILTEADKAEIAGIVLAEFTDVSEAGL